MIGLYTVGQLDSSYKGGVGSLISHFFDTEKYDVKLMARGGQNVQTMHPVQAMQPMGAGMFSGPTTICLCSELSWFR